MAVDQTGRDGRAIGIDDGGGAGDIDVLEAADGGDLAVLGDDGVGIKNGLFQRARYCGSRAWRGRWLGARHGPWGGILFRKLPAGQFCAYAGGGIKGFLFVCKWSWPPLAAAALTKLFICILMIWYE
jgi:hypothetical protein